MKKGSLWLDSVRLPKAPQLDRNLTVDVVVVGAGITGTTAAYLFKKRGYRVALLERAECGGVDTSYTTAHLTCVTDLRPHMIVKRFGKENARAVWDAGVASLDQISDIIRDEEIDCDFTWLPGFLHAPHGDGSDDRDSLKKDADIVHELGFDVSFTETVPHFRTPGMKVPHQATFHPMRYMAGLLKAIPGKGSYLFGRSAATGFSDKPLSVTAGKYKIHCAYVVIATHTPLMGNTSLVPATLFQTKLYPYTSYVFAAQVPKGSFPRALFWDTSDPYYYVRLHPEREKDFVIFGGHDHKTGQVTNTESVFRRLERVLHKQIPNARPTHRWSGQVIATNDGLPFMGETAEHQFAITGCSGNGMTLGTIGAMMSVDAFEQRPNPWRDLFDPHRKKLRGGTWNYLRENRDYPYYMVRDRLARSEGKSLRALKRNTGKILNLDGHKVAAYRDQHGHVTLRSPVCTHLGCIVAWNNAEGTWDCPCHGSRFMPTGEVMSGPAEEDLKPFEEPAKKNSE